MSSCVRCVKREKKENDDLGVLIVNIENAFCTVFFPELDGAACQHSCKQCCRVLYDGEWTFMHLFYIRTFATVLIFPFLSLTILCQLCLLRDISILNCLCKVIAYVCIVHAFFVDYYVSCGFIALPERNRERQYLPMILMDFPTTNHFNCTFIHFYQFRYKIINKWKTGNGTLINEENLYAFSLKDFCSKFWWYVVSCLLSNSN